MRWFPRELSQPHFRSHGKSSDMGLNGTICIQKLLLEHPVCLLWCTLVSLVPSRFPKKINVKPRCMSDYHSHAQNRWNENVTAGMPLQKEQMVEGRGGVQRERNRERERESESERQRQRDRQTETQSQRRGGGGGHRET